jgi:hypothetical protein
MEEEEEQWEELKAQTTHEILHHEDANWKKNCPIRMKGMRKKCYGHKNDENYIIHCLKNEEGKKILWKKHRLMMIQWGPPNIENKPTVDHINGIPTDNRLCNLRWATHKENGENKHKKEKTILTISLNFILDIPFLLPVLSIQKTPTIKRPLIKKRLFSLPLGSPYKFD